MIGVELSPSIGSYWSSSANCQQWDWGKWPLLQCSNTTQYKLQKIAKILPFANTSAISNQVLSSDLFSHLKGERGEGPLLHLMGRSLWEVDAGPLPVTQQTPVLASAACVWHCWNSTVHATCLCRQGLWSAWVFMYNTHCIWHSLRCCRI